MVLVSQVWWCQLGGLELGNVSHSRLVSSILTIIRILADQGAKSAGAGVVCVGLGVLGVPIGMGSVAGGIGDAVLLDAWRCLAVRVIEMHICHTGKHAETVAQL